MPETTNYLQRSGLSSGRASATAETYDCLHPTRAGLRHASFAPKKEANKMALSVCKEEKLSRAATEAATGAASTVSSQAVCHMHCSSSCCGCGYSCCSCHCCCCCCSGRQIRICPDSDSDYDYDSCSDSGYDCGFHAGFTLLCCLLRAQAKKKIKKNCCK